MIKETRNLYNIIKCFFVEEYVMTYFNSVIKESKENEYECFQDHRCLVLNIHRIRLL